MAELSKQEQMVKDYLEEEIKKDEALRNVYNADNIHECFEYIVKQARELAVNGCAMVEDAVVYHWAIILSGSFTRMNGLTIVCRMIK